MYNSNILPKNEDDSVSNDCISANDFIGREKDLCCTYFVQTNTISNENSPFSTKALTNLDIKSLSNLI